MQQLLHQAARARALLHQNVDRVPALLERHNLWTGSEHVTINGRSVKVMGYEESTSYLGRAFTFGKRNSKEFKNRVDIAWSKFMKHKAIKTARIKTECGK